MLCFSSAVAVRETSSSRAIQAPLPFLASSLLLTSISQQIVRWFAYRQSKPSAFKGDAHVKSSELNDPMFVMTCRLLGKSSKKPRKPIAYNLWAKDKTNKPAVQKVIESIPKDPSQKRHNVAAVVQAKKDLFEKQPRSTRKMYENMAVSKHKQLLKEWESNLSRPASKDPVAQQMYVSYLCVYHLPQRSCTADALTASHPLRSP